MIAMGNLKFKELEQLAPIIQMMEIQKVELDIAILVYPTLRDASLINWTVISLSIVFRAE